MYKRSFTEYIKTGLLAGLLITSIAVVMFYIFGFVFGHDVTVIGQDRDTLYVVFITFATFMAVFIGNLLFYVLQKFTKRPIFFYAIVVLLGFCINTYTAEADLALEYKLTAHLLHGIVAVLAFYLIPRFSRFK